MLGRDSASRNMNWESLLDDYGSAIEGRLKEHFKLLVSGAKKYHPFMQEVYEKLQEYVLRRGKRLASCSALLAYKGYAGDLNEGIQRVGVGIELYRHAILVHDDLVDEGDTRRGGAAYHRLFSVTRGRDFGKGIAVFMGDAAYALSIDAILKSGFGEPDLLRVVRLISECYREVNESQALDLLFEREKPDVDEWYAMASRRAASLFKATLLSGAILGGAAAMDLTTLAAAATDIGYAFDIQDDLIDTFADEREYGKPPGEDIARGKKPLHVVYALKLATPAEARVLKNVMGKGKISQQNLKVVREILRDTGALSATKAKSLEHAARAKASVAKTQMSAEGKDFFNGFIDYIEHSLSWYG